MPLFNQSQYTVGDIYAGQTGECSSHLLIALFETADTPKLCKKLFPPCFLRLKNGY